MTEQGGEGFGELVGLHAEGHPFFIEGSAADGRFKEGGRMAFQDIGERLGGRGAEDRREQVPLSYSLS